MNRLIIAMAAAASVATCAVPAAAQVNARQLNQERNIDAGVRSGKLTPREAATLRSEVRAIEYQARKFKRDGRYNPAREGHRPRSPGGARREDRPVEGQRSPQLGQRDTKTAGAGREARPFCVSSPGPPAASHRPPAPAPALRGGQ